MVEVLAFSAGSFIILSLLFANGKLPINHYIIALFLLIELVFFEIISLPWRSKNEI